MLLLLCHFFWMKSFPMKKITVWNLSSQPLRWFKTELLLVWHTHYLCVWVKKRECIVFWSAMHQGPGIIFFELLWKRVHWYEFSFLSWIFQHKFPIKICESTYSSPKLISLSSSLSCSNSYGCEHERLVVDPFVFWFEYNVHSDLIKVWNGSGSNIRWNRFCSVAAQLKYCFYVCIFSRLPQ